MKYIKIFFNWRIDVITILAALVLMLAMADSECVILFFATKLAAVILGYLVHVIAKRWDGKMPELDVLKIDE